MPRTLSSGHTVPEASFPPQPEAGPFWEEGASWADISVLGAKPCGKPSGMGAARRPQFYRCGQKDSVLQSESRR